MTIGAQRLEAMQGVLTALGAVVHAIQRERGCASLFIDSIGKIFAPELDEQIADTDKAISDLIGVASSLKQTSSISDKSSAFLDGKIDNLIALSDLRKSVNALDATYTKAINTYTFNIILPLIECMVLLAQQTTGFPSAKVGAYSNFLHFKERLGLERALGSRGFHTYAFRNPEFRDRMTSLLAEQQNYLSIFFALASPTQAECVQDVIDDKDMAIINRINEMIENDAPSSELEQFSGKSWHMLLTRTIDRFFEAEKCLVKDIIRPEGDAHGTDKQSFCEKEFSARTLELVKSMLLFKDLPDEELDQLMRHSQVRHYEKGKLMYLQGEPVSRFYIILKGWVKVFNGSENGDEAILHILGAGDTLLEGAVFLETTTPSSAQVIEDASLLSIPAPLIRERIASSNSFAINMLSNISLRSQSLVMQIEQSRLKSAQERVGGFLLSLRLNDPEDSNTITLPFDKALIASYLDMRAETLSRTLKKFRNDGFVVEQDSITLPDKLALCDYCDNHHAGKCVDAKSNACPLRE
ncbi:MAG: nitrate- and nitrite sensing domain-containing protein [Sphingomonadales bacterium]|nr:nitrate- and nitrite sensing domain-containing protein [Sphingomonadales bacterium]